MIPSVQPPSRRKLVLAVVGLVGLVAGGVAIGLVVTAPPQPLPAGLTTCVPQLWIPVRPVAGAVPADTRARLIAAGFRNDPEVAGVSVETQQQSYRQFQHEFQDIPELAHLGRPEALPAVVWLRPAQVDDRKLVAELRKRFPGENDLQSGNPCGP